MADSHKSTSKDSVASFHGYDLILHGDGTLYMPSENLLIVSDLHLEKGAALSHGAPLPAYDTIDTLQRLEARIRLCQPHKVVCLGDSFHNVERAFLLPPDGLALLHELSAMTTFLWVTGNHDATLPERLPGTVYNEVMCGAIRLCHEAIPPFDRPTISGHYHPKARIKLRAGTLSARCFVQDGYNLIMPAFGSYTGGLNICNPAFLPFISDDTLIYLAHDDKTFVMPFQKSRFFERK